ncbi:ABC transporter ATP-binding protein [Pradoshia sp.]
MLKVCNITAGYRSERPVLKDVSLEVKKGEFYALLGPNGSGKTTFIKAILDPKQLKMKGNVEIAGKEARQYSKDELARVTAVLSQEHAVSLDFTVEQIVLLGRYPYQGKGLFNTYKKEDYAIVDECLEKTNCMAFKHKYFQDLSGGEKQRVLLAKALAQSPQLLFLDEPTNHLDIKHSIELLNLLKELQLNNELTIVAILHDLNLASLYADRLALLKDGQKIAEGDEHLLLDESLLKSVYGVDLISSLHPVMGKPQISFIPAYVKA